jgi:hypothetical protein
MSRPCAACWFSSPCFTHNKTAPQSFVSQCPRRTATVHLTTNQSHFLYALEVCLSHLSQGKPSIQGILNTAWPTSAYKLPHQLWHPTLLSIHFYFTGHCQLAQAQRNPTNFPIQWLQVHHGEQTLKWWRSMAVIFWFFSCGLTYARQVLYHSAAAPALPSVIHTWVIIFPWVSTGHLVCFYTTEYEKYEGFFKCN